MKLSSGVWSGWSNRPCVVVNCCLLRLDYCAIGQRLASGCLIGCCYCWCRFRMVSGPNEDVKEFARIDSAAADGAPL